MRGRLTTVTVLAALMATMSPWARADDDGPARPPQQAKTGPGGAEYRHGKVVASRHGKGALAYHLFEPADPKPKTAPLIVFNHGYSAVDPAGYGRWIRHLVRRGNIVVYPVYQAGLFTASDQLTPNAIKAVKAAIAELKRGEHVRPDLEKFAIAGHSAGGIITANMAALAKRQGLPAPRAVMCIEPGISRVFKLANLTKMPKDVLLLCVAGDQDRIVGNTDARLIYHNTLQIPKANKDFVLVRSDEHGQPPLRAGHLSPASVARISADSKSSQAFFNSLFSAGESKQRGDDEAKRDGNQPRGDGNEARGDGHNAKGDGPRGERGELAKAIRAAVATDALDYYGYWKLFDGLCDAAFYHKHREYALGDTPQQRFMGKWSDGRAVRELTVTDEP